MPKVNEREHVADEAKRQHLRVNAIIRERVMHLMGEPSGPYLVQVRPLWGDFYRVNIVLGDSAGPVRIANSYFLRVNGDHSIAESTPQISRQY